MECKYDAKEDKYSIVNELIDTLWNVNTNLVQSDFFSQMELIDTLWNVNFVLEERLQIQTKN